MNKLILVFLLLSFNINAKPNIGDFKVNFSYVTKIKKKESYVLERIDNEIYFNGIKLISQKVMVNKKNIQYLVLNKKDIHSVFKCSKGNYKFNLKRGKINKIEEGCLGTERFGSLIRAFRSF